MGRERLSVRQGELQRMFRHIRSHVPAAKTVLGNSWMYNIAAYRRIFPSAFTATLPATAYDELQYLALWGQCFDRNWKPKLEVTDELLRRVDQANQPADLQSCFP